MRPFLILVSCHRMEPAVAQDLNGPIDIGRRPWSLGRGVGASSAPGG
jgi:hypothetical protein